MSFVDNMVIAFTVLILLTNAIIISFTGLPSNVDATQYYDFGLEPSQRADLNSSYANVLVDANGIRGGTSSAFSASTTQQTSQNILDSILLGIGNVCNVLTAGICGQTVSLVQGIIKYMFYLVFGYAFWIDYFLNPLMGQGQISTLFVNIGFGLKSFFFIIQLIGFVKIVIPIFTGGRTT